MLSQHATHFIVHSPGRTGSMLLSRNLGASLGTLHDPVPVQHIVSKQHYDQQIKNNLKFDVLQTHVIHNLTISKYTRVFNVRQNVIEHVLSFILSQHYQTFHVKSDNQAPFLCDVHLLNSICNQIIYWYQHYATQLTPNDHVVVYETMMEKLSTEPNRRVFENKKKLILNFNEACDIINRYDKKITKSLQIFLQHSNPWNIYKFITHSIKF